MAEDGFESYTTAMRSIAEYEKFFLLAARHRDLPHVPSHRVDIVWQRHMLDTVAYAEDCTRWAGAYLHRIDVVLPDAYRKTLDRLGVADPEIWDQPGPASISVHGPDPINQEELHGSLEKEDFSALLARVRFSLQNKPGHPTWVAEARELLEADSLLAVEEYRRFIGLLISEAGPLTPSKLLDEFWHQHVLDSRNYASFCSRTAGRFLHHIPNYEKPHEYHDPAFRRTHDLYRKRFGYGPPDRVWSYMGESGGGCCSPPEPPPLYAIDKPSHMIAELRIGEVDSRHFESLHPILAHNGLPHELWLALLREIDSVPRISWSKFSAIKANSPLIYGLILATLLIASIKTWPSGIMFFYAFILFIIYYARWLNRAFEQTRVVHIITDFNSAFAKYRAFLYADRRGIYIRCLACPISAG